MKTVKNIITEEGQAILNAKTGKKIPVQTKTIYTFYTDGTNDCRVEILKPIDLLGKQERIK